MKLFFFGNYFYAVCVIALSIETAVQLSIPLAPIIYYLFIFCATVVYYTKAYVTEVVNTKANERSSWYVLNKQFVFTSQALLTVLIAVFGLLMLPNIMGGIKTISVKDVFFISLFPVIASLYYGFGKKLNFRKSHWLKPFVIGFVWSGVVTFYPIFYYQIQAGTTVTINYVSWLLFIKNLMFICVLCIMFDIKDYATDYNQQLKTFVVSFGIRKTIFYIIFPLTLLGFASNLLYAITIHSSIIKTVIISVPFILLLLTAYSLYKRRSIFYYLVIIDGLMLLKAICGIVAAKYC